MATKKRKRKPTPHSRTPEARRARGQEPLVRGFVPTETMALVRGLRRHLGAKVKGPLGAVCWAVAYACKALGVEGEAEEEASE